ncbi:MAG: hypothetical protein K2Q22_13300 [Cytophagales bacterium]|nr:hypothetical protein [Cytophagales bacterium]
MKYKQLLFVFGVLAFVSGCRLKNKVLQEQLVIEHKRMEMEYHAMQIAHDSLEKHYLIMIEKRLSNLENYLSSATKELLQPLSMDTIQIDTTIHSDSAVVDSIKQLNFQVKQMKVNIGPLIVKHKELIEEHRELLVKHEELMHKMEKGNYNFREIEASDKELLAREKTLTTENEKILETTSGVLLGIE